MRFAASFCWLSVFGLALATALASSVSAHAQERKIAIVIAASYYEDPTIAALPFVANDASVIVETLASLGFTVYPFCESNVKFDPNDKRIAKPQKPTKENIERALSDENGPLRNVFKAPKKTTLLVYFSGHGGQAPERDNSTLLLLRDSYRDDLTETTLSAQAAREMMSATECEKRLLILDACHAGGTRGPDDPTYAELFNNEFVEARFEGTPTFASCDFASLSGALLPLTRKFDASQKKRDVSVFTYWLNEGLKGYADGAVENQDADGVIASDELFAYVAQNLEWTLASGAYWQTPALVASKNEKPFAVCAAPRRDYWETIDGLAEQIVTKATILGKDEIVVEQFAETFASPELKRDRAEVDALHSFAESATKRLQQSVERKREALRSGTTMFNDDQTSSDKSVVVKPVVEARIDARGEKTYAMRCDVCNANSSSTVMNAAASVLVVAQSVLRKIDAAETKLKSTDAGNASAAPFVRIEAKGPNDAVWQTRPICEIGGFSWVELNPGETYRVVLAPSLALIPAAERTNGAPKICARLLVDGRNSLPQYEPYAAPTGDFFWQLTVEQNKMQSKTRGETSVSLNAVEETAEEAAVPPMAVAPVVPLDEARYWVVDAGKKYPIEGFYDPSLQTCDSFYVAPADSSEAENDDERERGLIVVAFYKATASRSPDPDVQTIPGPKKKCSAFVVKGWEIGANLAFLRLRCGSANYLAKLKKATESWETRDDE